MPNLSFKSSNLALPNEQAMMPVSFDFTAVATIAEDLQQEQTQNLIDNVQSVFVDNYDNAEPFTLQFIGGNPPQRLIVPPFSQGWFPISIPVGVARWTASSNSGARINCIFSNLPMPYSSWATEIPVVTNMVVDLAPAAVGDNIIVPGVAGQIIRVFSFLLDADGVQALRFFSGAGAVTQLCGPLFFGANFNAWLGPPPATPLFKTLAGQSLNLRATTAVNVGALIRYTQR